MTCEFVFICEKTWEELTPTDNPKVKDCDQCGKTVTFCEDFKELTECAKQQKCVCYFNPEARSSAMNWDKEKNKIEFIHDPKLTQAEKNKMTSAFVHEYITAYPPKTPELSTREARIEALGNLEPTLGMISYVKPNSEELKRLRNDPNNPFQRKPEDKPAPWFKKLWHFLMRKF